VPWPSASSAALLPLILDPIRSNWSRVYNLYLKRGWVRTEPREHVVDVWYMAARPETYVRFVSHDGWTDEQYAAWLPTAFCFIRLAPAKTG
jgi:hypothetical protein